MDTYELVPVHERGDPATDLAGCIRAVEVHDATYRTALRRVAELLCSRGLDQGRARALSRTWLRRGDFLLADLDGSFPYVVGNPPYVRQEEFPDG